MSDTLKCRRCVFENSAATALIAASMPPMPRPVMTRQIERSTSPVTVVAMSMPSDMTARHPRIVGRRPILSATPPSTIEPIAMPMSSIESTMPSAARSIPHSVAMPGEAKLMERMSNPSSAFRAIVMPTTPICSRLIGGLREHVSRICVHTAERITFGNVIDTRAERGPRNCQRSGAICSSARRSFARMSAARRSLWLYIRTARHSLTSSRRWAAHRLHECHRSRRAAWRCLRIWPALSGPAQRRRSDCARTSREDSRAHLLADIGRSTPGLIFFRGGGFVLGTLDSSDRMCRELAHLAGRVVVSVDYRLAPEHPFPAAVDDAYAATKYVIENPGEFGIDATQVATCGESAGGNLAAVTALEAGAMTASRPLTFPAPHLPSGGLRR